MEDYVWLVLLVLAFPVMALVGFVMALTQRGRIRALEARVFALEAALLGEAGGARTAPQAPVAPRGAPAAPPPAPVMPSPATPVPIPSGPARPAAPIPVPPTQIPPRPRPPKPAGGVAGLEERLGARWAVWVGGLALALGGIFLVRYAVEQDLIGPAARVGLGLALAAVLLGAGEALRRLDRRTAFAGVPAAYVPGVLTAAGTMTAFGSIFAAYQLYGLIPPAVAFVALAVTGIATILAALLHGPALGALGFAGAALTPFLITTDHPNALSVAALIAVVGPCALAVARVRLWGWFAWLALAGMTAWGLTLLVFDTPQAVPAAGALGAVMLAVTAVLLAPGLFYGPASSGRIDALSTCGAAGAVALGAAAAIYGAVHGHDAGTPLLLFAGLALATLALAWKVPAMTFSGLAVGLGAAAILQQWVFPPDSGSTIAPAGPMAGAAPEPARLHLSAFLTFALAMGGAMAASGFLGAAKAKRAIFALGWAATATAGPILIMTAAYARLTEFDISYAFAAVGLALALLFTFAAETLSRTDAHRPAAGAFAAGAVTALGLALAFALEKGWLTVGLALAALAVAWVETKRPLPGLRQLAAGLGLLVLARVGWDPRIAGDDLGTRPILNWLLWGYGVPAAAFASAAHLLARRADDWSRRLLETLALIFAVLLAAFEVRHLAHGGDVYATGTSLFESGLLGSIYGAYALGLSRMAAASGRFLQRIFSDVMAAFAGILGVNSLIDANPFHTGDAVGGALFNDLLIGYGLPALLAAGYAIGLPAGRTLTRTLARAFAVVMALTYLTLEVARLFQGPVLEWDGISSAEWYAYSAVWLVFGLLLLGLGLWRGSQTLRLASGVVMAATVLKVFLSDMKDLEGVLRALSFIGLGLVLVAMGWIYQRLLAQAPPAPPPASGDAG